MHCMRCEGLMVPDDLIDIQESSMSMWMRGWRCVACGNIIDLLIQRHRVIQGNGAMRLIKEKTPSQRLLLPAKVPA